MYFKHAFPLKHGRFHVFAEDRAEDIHDLAQRGIDLDGFDDGRHRILGAFGNATQVIQRAFDGCIIALAAHAIETLEVRALSDTVDIQRWNLDIFFYNIIVDADDGAPVLVDLLLVAIGRFGTFALEDAVLDAGQHAAKRIDAIQVVLSRLLRLVRQLLYKVGATNRIDGIDDTAFAGDDLLRAQGNQHGPFGGQRQGFIQRVGMQRVGAT